MRKVTDLSHLVDTNVLLRLEKSEDGQASLAREVTERLRQRGEDLCVARQNLIEFRNTASRPLDKNGLGLTPADADFRRFESLPPDLGSGIIVVRPAVV